MNSKNTIYVSVSVTKQHFFFHVTSPEKIPQYSVVSKRTRQRGFQTKCKVNSGHLVLFKGIFSLVGAGLKIHCIQEGHLITWLVVVNFSPLWRMKLRDEEQQGRKEKENPCQFRNCGFSLTWLLSSPGASLSQGRQEITVDVHTVLVRLDNCIKCQWSCCAFNIISWFTN